MIVNCDAVFIQLTTLDEGAVFDEETATWENTGMDNQPENPEVIATIVVPQEQPGITPIVVSISPTTFSVCPID